LGRLEQLFQSCAVADELASEGAVLRERGHALILSEGGPTLFGSLLTADSVDELFLTVSPLLAGRTAALRLTGHEHAPLRAAV